MGINQDLINFARNVSNNVQRTIKKQPFSYLGNAYWGMNDRIGKGKNGLMEIQALKALNYYWLGVINKMEKNPEKTPEKQEHAQKDVVKLKELITNIELFVILPLREKQEPKREYLEQMVTFMDELKERYGETSLNKLSSDKF